MKILYKTIHGSHLYGLSHKDSDNDFYTVVDKVKTGKAKFAKQTIIGDEDSMVVDFGTWLHYCERGVPQALEAMYSTMPIEDKIGALRAGYRVGTQTHDRYQRTIKSFILTDNYKKKRHGLRLAYNLRDIREFGRFDPTLKEEQVEIISSVACLPSIYVLEWAMRKAWQ